MKTKSKKNVSKKTTKKAAKARKADKAVEANGSDKAQDRFGARAGSKGAKINKVLLANKGKRLTMAEISELSKVGRPRCQSHITVMRERKLVVRNSEGYKLRTTKAVA